MKKILVVEDDQVIAKVIDDALQKAGFEVLKAVDGYQGQQTVLSQKPDLVVLDLMLPAGNGVELLQNLRKSTLTQTIPIIVTTSFRDEEVKKEMEQVGVQGYFYKPFEPSELIDKIKIILKV